MSFYRHFRLYMQTVVEDLIENNTNNTTNPMIKKQGRFYYCRQHPKIQNIYLEVIEDHLKYSKEHLQKVSIVDVK
jgi:hypothetical protein